MAFGRNANLLTWARKGELIVATPFPGMDPFLEHPAYWLDFHSRFVNSWCEAVADALPPHYEASLGECVYLIDHDPEARRLGYPDVAVTQGDTAVSGAASSPAGLATLEPVTIPLVLLEGPRESYIEILYHPDRSLVAVLDCCRRPTSSIPAVQSTLRSGWPCFIKTYTWRSWTWSSAAIDCPCRDLCRLPTIATLLPAANAARTVRSFPGLFENLCPGCRCRYGSRIPTSSSISVSCSRWPTNGDIFAGGSIIENFPPSFVTRTSSGRRRWLMFGSRL
jgi:hypothetical protein